MIDDEQFYKEFGKALFAQDIDYLTLIEPHLKEKLALSNFLKRMGNLQTNYPFRHVEDDKALLDKLLLLCDKADSAVEQFFPFWNFWSVEICSTGQLHG